MQQYKKRLVLSATVLMAASLNAQAEVPVKIFNQNIQAHLFCLKSPDGMRKQNKLVDLLQQALKQQPFDFVFLQEYEAQTLEGKPDCRPLFQRIIKLGYTLAKGREGDPTIFYRTKDWTPNSELIVQMVPNTDGRREGLFGDYRRNGTDYILTIGSAHLCVQWSYQAYTSYCAIEGHSESKAHRLDFDKMLETVKGRTNWLVAGDMNVGTNKGEFIKKITDQGGSNIDQLNKQPHDMAFYKGANITDMTYENKGKDLGGAAFSDHDGFILKFNLR